MPNRSSFDPLLLLLGLARCTAEDSQDAPLPGSIAPPDKIRWKSSAGAIRCFSRPSRAAFPLGMAARALQSGGAVTSA